MEIWSWMKALEDQAEQTFGDRLVCLGLMGSYARGEATENSDIDAVLILDTVSLDDLRKYREILKWLPHREKVCGFVSGKDELQCWDRADLFQFCRDTQVIYGSLDFVQRLVGPEDVRRAVHIGACNLYHGAVHCMMHGQSMSDLAAQYKAAFFVLQSDYYFRSGVYVRSHRELTECMSGPARRVLQDAMAFKNGAGVGDFEELAERLIELSGELIRRYGGGV